MLFNDTVCRCRADGVRRGAYIEARGVALTEAFRLHTSISIILLTTLKAGVLRVIRRSVRHFLKLLQLGWRSSASFELHSIGGGELLELGLVRLKSLSTSFVNQLKLLGEDLRAHPNIILKSGKDGTLDTIEVKEFDTEDISEVGIEAHKVDLCNHLEGKAEGDSEQSAPKEVKIG